MLSGLGDLYPHILISEVTAINKYKHTHEPSIRQRCTVKKVFGFTRCRGIFPILRSRMPIHGRWNNYLKLQSEFFNWREGKPVPLLRAGLFPPSENSNNRSPLLNGNSANYLIQGGGRNVPPLPPPPPYTH